MTKKIRVLQIMNNMENGGIEAFCLNIHRSIDKEKFKIDYLLMLGEGNFYNEEIKQMGQEVINLKNIKYPKYLPSFLKGYYKVNRVFKEYGQYDVVHAHQCKGLNSILIASYINKIKVKVIHSHNAFLPSSDSFFINFKIKVYSKIRSLLSYRLKTVNLGCSEAACDYMFGENSVKKNKAKVIYNGIDLNKFNKEIYDKKEVVKKFNINEEKINFINVGRFHSQKNQLFLIETFSELLKIRNNINLTIVGHGELEEKIKEKIGELNLSKYVTLLPNNIKIPEVLKAMDYFLLPSIYEGLGIVLIEAQAMGLTCFASNYVPKEANIGLCKYIDLEVGVKGWAETINSYINNTKENVGINKLKIYDINNVVKEIEKIYS